MTGHAFLHLSEEVTGQPTFQPGLIQIIGSLCEFWQYLSVQVLLSIIFVAYRLNKSQFLQKHLGIYLLVV